MSVDNYISDYRLEEIRKEYGEKIVSFSKVRQQIESWYKNFGLSYPSTSVNNFRDSWFHYRKIWLERSFYEVTCQMATFDEHLQRAEKDAVVNFFQLISQELEFWYQIEECNIPEEFAKDIEEKTDLIFGNEEIENKINSLWKQYERKEQEASFVLIYAAKKYVLNSKCKFQQIQKFLHSIKNITLKIRFGASDIQRLEYPGEYIKLSNKCYNELEEFFQQKENREMFFLLGLTDVVKANIENYRLEKGVGE